MSVVPLYATREAVAKVHFHLKECIYQMVLESQLPHKVVNLLFTVANQNNKWTILWRS